MSNVLTFQVRNSQILDNIEADWREHGLYQLTAVDGFPADLAHAVERVSADELRVTNTEGQLSVFKVRKARGAK